MTAMGITGILLAGFAVLGIARARSTPVQWLSAVGLGLGLVLLTLGLRQNEIAVVPPPAAPSGKGNDHGKRLEARNAVPGYDPEKNRPASGPGRGYATSETCRECHAHEHETWHASYHRTMTQVPDAQTVIGDFENASFTNYANGARFLMTRSSNQFWVTLSRTNQPLELIGETGRRNPDIAGAGGSESSDDPAPLSWPVALLTGSHHMQGYWAPSGLGHTLSLLPVMYLREEGKWIPRSAAFLQPPGHPFGLEAGRWNTTCVQCHATAGETQTVEPFGYFETRVAEFGITCESCHGPGAEHVRLWREAKQHGRTSLPDDPIVNPVNLPKERGSQVCGACHARRERRPEFAKLGFKPGDDLNRTHLVYLRRPEVMAEVAKTFEPTELASDVEAEFDHSFWRDGQPRASANEFNGLLETPCYQRGEMTCFSCHQLHQSKRDSRPRKEWANDQLRLPQNENGACLQCHEARRYEATSHTHHRAGSSGGVCYNCHMPHTSYGLMKAIRAHQVTSPDVAVTLSTTRPNACNLCHLDRTLEWTADYLADWYGIRKPALSERQKSYSAAALDVLQGNAGLRAITAWNMGWAPAMETSGADWMAPLLAELLDDPYDTVRYIAGRTLKRIPGFDNLRYDFVGPPAHRQAVARRVRELWNSRHSHRSARPPVLIGADGRFDQATVRRLLQDRDQRPILLKE